MKIILGDFNAKVRSENVFKNFRANQDRLEFNGPHQLLVYANNVNIFGGSIHTIKKTQIIYRLLVKGD